MKSIYILILLTCITSPFSTPIFSKSLKNSLSSSPIKKLPLKWKVSIGQTTYRTSLAYANGRVFIPSNGKFWHMPGDPKDGVYVLNAKSGKVLAQLVTGDLGDRDVNGVAVSNSKLVFGDDNNSIAAFDWNFKRIWNYKATGDFEGAPALVNLNEDAILDVIAATESGELLALDGKDGSVLWKFNPVVNPIQNLPEERSFMASPSLVDVNRDGFRDVLIGNRNGNFYALNGKTGKLIWKHQSIAPSGFIGSSFATNSHIYVLESYGYLHKFSTRGRSLQRFELGPERRPQTVSMPSVSPAESMLIGSTFSESDAGLWTLVQHQPAKFQKKGKISASAAIANVDNLPGLEFVIVTEAGWLYFISDSGTLRGSFKLPAGSETTPFIADIDDDGLLEIIVCLQDGVAYCYDLPSKGPVYWGSFRANPYNTGLQNDTLPEDGILANYAQFTTAFTITPSTAGYRYKPWLSAPVQPNLISQKGIGHAQLGLTLAQFKLKAGPGYTSQVATLANGLKAMAISQNNEILYYLCFPQNKPILDSSRITMVITNNPRFKTKDGIYSGMSLFNASSILGSPVLSYNRNYPLEEKTRFTRQPRWLVFTSYSKIKAGKYKSKDRINYTKSYQPGAVLQFVVVR